jgi:hypothetical protein
LIRGGTDVGMGRDESERKLGKAGMGDEIEGKLGKAGMGAKSEGKSGKAGM